MTEREKIIEQLSAYMDGELSPDQMRKVQRAVNEDAEIAKQLRELEKTRELISSIPAASLGNDFAAKIMQAVEKSKSFTSDSAEGQSAQTPKPVIKLVNYRRLLASAAVLTFTALASIYFAISVLPGNNHQAQDYFAATRKPAKPKSAPNNIYTKSPVHSKPGSHKRIQPRHAGKKGGYYRDDESAEALNPTSKSCEGFALQTKDNFKEKSVQPGKPLVATAGVETLTEIASQNTNNVAVYTADLKKTQNQVEKILAKNNINVVSIASKLTANQASNISLNPNYLNQRRQAVSVKDDEIVFVVNVPLNQQAKINKLVNTQLVRENSKTVSQLNDTLYKQAVTDPKDMLNRAQVAITRNRIRTEKVAINQKAKGQKFNRSDRSPYSDSPKISADSQHKQSKKFETKVATKPKSASETKSDQNAGDSGHHISKGRPTESKDCPTKKRYKPNKIEDKTQLADAANPHTLDEKKNPSKTAKNDSAKCPQKTQPTSKGSTPTAIKTQQNGTCPQISKDLDTQTDKNFDYKNNFPGKSELDFNKNYGIASLAELLKNSHKLNAQNYNLQNVIIINNYISHANLDKHRDTRKKLKLYKKKKKRKPNSNLTIVRPMLIRIKLRKPDSKLNLEQKKATKLAESVKAELEQELNRQQNQLRPSNMKSRSTQPKPAKE